MFFLMTQLYTVKPNDPITSKKLAMSARVWSFNHFLWVRVFQENSMIVNHSCLIEEAKIPQMSYLMWYHYLTHNSKSIQLISSKWIIPHICSNFDAKYDIISSHLREMNIAVYMQLL